MRAKKGFTLIETIVTLSIIGASFALTAGVVAALMNVQKKSNDQLIVNKDLKKADSFIKDFISFASIHTDSVSFGLPNVSANQVRVGAEINSSTYTYTMKFSDHTLSLTNTYSGSNSYFKKTGNLELTSINQITFSYNDTISLLKASMSVNDTSLVYSYALR